MPAITRSSLPGAGAPKITYSGATLWTRGDVMVPIRHQLQEQVASMYGRVTKTRQGRSIEISVPLYGFWANLPVLFPDYFLSGLPSARMFGTSDTPLVLNARNGDKITLANAQITKIANLRLAANQQIFAADVTFTALIANNTAPDDANAYYTIASEAYTEGDFPQSGFKSKTWTGAWGSRTGFTNILTQEGWTVDWEIRTTPDIVDGIGPVDMFTDLFWARASCIPVGPTLDQLSTAVDFQGENAAVGGSIADDIDDLTLEDGSGSSLTLIGCAMVETGLVFGPAKKRIGPTVWESTRLGFAGGIPPAIATVV